MANERNKERREESKEEIKRGSKRRSKEGREMSAQNRLVAKNLSPLKERERLAPIIESF